MNKYICTACGLMFGLSTYAAEIHFKDVTESAGLAWQGPSFAAAVADFDKNGSPDLAVSRHGAVSVYRNTGGGQFENISGEKGFIPGLEGDDTHGIAWIDYNQDGWPDIFTSDGANRGQGNGHPNRILINRQGAGFDVVTLPELLQYPDAGSRSMLPVDLQQTGVLDYVLMCPSRPNGKPVVFGQEGGSWIARDTGLDQFDAESVIALGVAENGNPRIALQTSGKDAGAILEFDKDKGAFRDISAELGVKPFYNVMRVVPMDYDNDGDLDLYYVCGRNWVSVPPEVVDERELFFGLSAGAPRKGNVIRFRADGVLELSLLVNGMQGTHKLRLGAAANQIARNETELKPDDPRLLGKPAAFSSTPGIYLWKDSDGVFSLALVGQKATPYAALSGKITASSGSLALAEPEAPLPGRPNRLYENRAGHYVDVTVAAGVGDAGAGADAVAADFDNDGDLDLYVINGTDQYRNVPNVFYRNNGDGTFENITTSLRMAGPTEGRGDSVAVFDADGDGDLDLFYGNGGGPRPQNLDGHQLFFRNDTQAGNWCQVDIESPYGVLVKASVNGRVLSQMAGGMTDRFGCSLAPVHIGLGAATQAEIEVYRPSGKVTRHIVNAGETLFVKKN
jgi:hypothetical protein